MFLPGTVHVCTHQAYLGTHAVIPAVCIWKMYILFVSAAASVEQLIIIGWLSFRHHRLAVSFVIVG